jgi:methyl-accepting chemotaxis protein
MESQMLDFFKSGVRSESQATLTAISRSQAVIEFNPDGTIITANHNFLTAMGYTLDEIKGKHHRMFVAPKERDSEAYRRFWERLARGKYDAGEYKRLGKGDREVWIQASYNPVCDANGKPFKVVKLASDITDLKLQMAGYVGQIAAIGKSQAVIEFNMDGTIITANDNFLHATGYTLEEIKGKHHRIFVDPAERESAEYKVFWERLGRGEYDSGEYKRVGKGGKEIWIQASYNPILDMNGKPFKVVKFATDVTRRKLQSADHAGQIAAIGKSQAVIEFNMDGTIIAANQNFLAAMGYTLDEIRGKHHRMFVDPAERDSEAYRAFWERLNRGAYDAGEYKRVGKHGKEIWIQASYNPILDLNGKPFKVVKFASDVTRQVIARKKSEHVRGLMESVAAGAEELNVSVREISASMSRSKDTAENANDRVIAADQATQRLTQAAESMGGIISLINDITSQINLLSLNATIESARAGEAGRGFAVVANEVKNLASQAKTATERIAQEIEGMRGISGDVVAALASIKQSIEQVREYVTSTAAAVEEQTAVAKDMSNGMQRAAAEAAAIG